MKVSGFTFIRNAQKFDFPVVEAIQSALPIVDEFVVNVGQSEDNTLALIRSISSPKIKIIESIWDESLRKDGKILGLQQDVALSHCTGDWALLLQGDEVLHEEDFVIIQNAMQRYLDQKEVLGLIFWMRHFKGDYWSLDPWMYRKATRIVRNTGTISSATDGCDFMAEGMEGMIKSGPAGRLIDARMFHYGWVKDPKVLEQKLRFQINLYEGEDVSGKQMDLEAYIRSQFPNYDILKEYKETHPKVMEERIGRARRLQPRRSRWLNWKFYREVLLHGFKG